MVESIYNTRLPFPSYLLSNQKYKKKQGKEQKNLYPIPIRTLEAEPKTLIARVTDLNCLSPLQRTKYFRSSTFFSYSKKKKRKKNKSSMAWKDILDHWVGY